MVRLPIPLAVPFNYYLKKFFFHYWGSFKISFLRTNRFFTSSVRDIPRIENESAGIENQCIHSMHSVLLPLDRTRDSAHARVQRDVAGEPVERYRFGRLKARLQKCVICIMPAL